LLSLVGGSSKETIVKIVKKNEVVEDRGEGSINGRNSYSCVRISGVKTNLRKRRKDLIGKVLKSEGGEDRKRSP